MIVFDEALGLWTFDGDPSLNPVVAAAGFKFKRFDDEPTWKTNKQWSVDRFFFLLGEWQKLNPESFAARFGTGKFLERPWLRTDPLDPYRWLLSLPYQSDRHVAEEERSKIKDLGFAFNNTFLCWETNTPEAAWAVREFADSKTLSNLEAEIERRNKIREAARAHETKWVCPAPEGLLFRPYQNAGVEFILDRFAEGKHVLLGDEMGLGKTLQVIGVLNCRPDIERVLIACPASLKINWKREIEKWSTNPRTVGIASGSDFPSSEIVVVNYDILARHSKTIRASEWDLLVLDEAQYVRTRGTLRTTHALGGQLKKAKGADAAERLKPIPAKHRLFLTGTPLVHRPANLWQLIHALDPATWTNWYKFAVRYCDGHQSRFGFVSDGASNLDELALKLGPLMVRRLKSDVLAELPPKRRQAIILEPPNNLRAKIAHERRAFTESFKQTLGASGHGVAVAFEEMSAIRREIALSKADAVHELVSDHLESDDTTKVIVACHHKELVSNLAAKFGGIGVKLTGDTGQRERQAAVDRFQSDPDCRVFLGTIGAAGVGITLTAASVVVMAELSWAPGEVLQMEDRAVRIGQKKSVLVQYVVYDESVEAHIAETCCRKQEAIDATVDPETTFRFEATALRSTEPKPASAEAVKPRSLEEVQAIKAALRILAGNCDGAIRPDGVGFNRFDSEIGKRLAAKHALSSGEINLAAKLVSKYKKQLPDNLVEKLSSGE